jgi:hypothetical protein
MLRIRSWKPPLYLNRDIMFLFPILSHCCDKNGAPFVPRTSETEDLIEQARDWIPNCVTELAAF